MYAREVVDPYQQSCIFCGFAVKKLRKRLAVRKNRRTFAPANEKGTPDFVGAVTYARSSRGALRQQKRRSLKY